MNHFRKKGFSLIELMAVVAIVAILLSLSYPSYLSFIRKAKRAEAQTILLDWANRQEIWNADNPGYNTGIDPSDNEYFAFTMVSTATSFVMTATAQGGQAYDKEAGVACSSLTLNQAGELGPSGHEKCWAR